jgi:GNAT superfamily N-acetyltransferase
MNTTKPVPKIREALSDRDYHRAYPIILQLIPDLDMGTYTNRAFVARATGYRLFISEIGTSVVGVIGLVPNHNIHDGFVMYIEHIVVDEQYRGQGFGSMLLDFAEQRTIEEGCTLIQLDTDEGTETHRIYERHGYVKTGSYYEKTLKRPRASKK